jgi:hypothetical protein
MNVHDSVNARLDPLDPLQAALQARTSGEAARWLEQAVRQAAIGPRESLLSVYTQASMRLGRLPLGTPVSGHSFPPVAEGLALDRWTLEDAARATFLLARANHAAPGPFEEDARACYDMGDAREQESWLRGVTLLPAAESFLPLVVDACRTNILPLFEAVACGNPYPGRYFPERNFNQLVMKALFNGVRLDRIVSLPSRLNAELTRMATDFAAERRAAGRPVPSDIGLAMTGAAA